MVYTNILFFFSFFFACFENEIISVRFSLLFRRTGHSPLPCCVRGARVMRTIFILLLYNHLFAVVVAVAAVLFCTCNANCWNNPIRTDAKQKKYRSVIAVVGSISIARTKEALDSLRMCAVRSTFLDAFLPLPPPSSLSFNLHNYCHSAAAAEAITLSSNSRILE